MSSLLRDLICIIAVEILATVPRKPGSCDQNVPPLCGCVTVWHERLIGLIHCQGGYLVTIILTSKTVSKLYVMNEIYMSIYVDLERSNQRGLP